MVHGIVQKIGGHIKGYSEPQKGTTMHVFFPKIENAEGDAAGDREDALPVGHEHICLVDDEQPILEMTQIMLENLGYKVTPFGNAREALAVFQDGRDKFDLIVTDLTMPEITGLVFIEQVLAVQPDLPIILCTGFSELVSKQQAEAAGAKYFLKKPILMADLARAIRHALQ